MLSRSGRAVWAAPQSGIMFGQATTNQNGQLAFFEQSRIMLTSSPATYVVSPNGQRAATFYENPKEPQPEKGHAISFENSANEFPQRIAYRSVGSDGLAATVSMLDGSRAANYAWTRCKN